MWVTGKTAGERVRGNIAGVWIGRNIAGECVEGNSAGCPEDDVTNAVAEEFSSDSRTAKILY